MRAEPLAKLLAGCVCVVCLSVPPTHSASVEGYARVKGYFCLCVCVRGCARVCERACVVRQLLPQLCRLKSWRSFFISFFFGPAQGHTPATAAVPLPTLPFLSYSHFELPAQPQNAGMRLMPLCALNKSRDILSMWPNLGNAF